MTSAFRDRPEFKRGRTGEQIIAEQVRARGWHVIPSYDYNGEDDHAPRMEGPVRAVQYILPDLDVCRRGDRRWAEIKTKHAASMGRISGELEHGIPLRHLRNYQAVQRESGAPVWLFIYEESTGLILYQKLDVLGPGRLSNGARMGAMVYWLRRHFAVWTPPP